MFVLQRTIFLAGLVLAGSAGLGPGVQAGAGTGQIRVSSATGVPEVAAATLRRFSADLVVRHRRLTSSGVPVGLPRPDAVMRLVREDRGGRWVTTLSVAQAPGALIDEPGGPVRLANPFLVSRVEFTEGDEQPRLFDHRGQPVRALTADDLRLVGAAQAMQQTGRAGRGESAADAGVLVAEAGRQTERRAELERRFGAVAGRVRGLDRYVASTADVRHEVLVTPDTVLPVELVTSSGTAGHVRTGVTYEAHGRYGYVRRLMRSEHHFGGTDAGRAVTEVELANVVLSGEVRR